MCLNCVFRIIFVTDEELRNEANQHLEQQCSKYQRDAREKQPSARTELISRRWVTSRASMTGIAKQGKPSHDIQSDDELAQVHKAQKVEAGQGIEQ